MLYSFRHGFRGGHLACIFDYGELEDFIVAGPAILNLARVGVVFVDVYSDIEVLHFPASTYIYVKADVTCILPLLAGQQCISVANKHGILCGSKCTKSIVFDMAQNHSCAICYSLTYVFALKPTRKFADKEKQVSDAKENVEDVQNVDSVLEPNSGPEPIIAFPPEPLSHNAIKNIVTTCVKKMELPEIREGGCAVCGQLVSNTQLSRLKAVKNLLHILEAPGLTCVPRKKNTNPIKFIPGPVIDHSFMVDMFISDILRFENDQCEGTGDVEGYYGTVEQQGRLTLHLHTMLWIRGALSSQEIRDKILDSDSSWKDKLIEWLEGCHTGEFLTGSQQECKCVKPTILKSTSSNKSDNQDDCAVKDADVDESEDEDTGTFLATSKRAKHVLLDYLSGHPLASTHKCSLMLPTNKKFKFMVPNFMGIPPRRDQGDQEYYCIAMLALFVPWQSGEDLKTSEETWDEGFLKQAFSEQHSRVMNNFNLQYECLDAKDDFRSEMKANSDGDVPLPFLSNSDFDPVKQSDNLDGVL
ncbi:hypothetical protein IMY05_C1357000100 [Salix suchowensis]|nr:hypothetical protein IMY05_C1357000100 [Salix suchowensis]